MAETAAPTADGLRTDIADAWKTYIAELQRHGDGWEARPSGAPDGENAWSARQVAEHIAGASGYFGSQIAAAIEVDGPGMQRYSFESAADAVAATPAAHDALMGVFAKVEDGDLAKEIEFPPLGTQTVGYIVGVVAHHLRDHAKQLQTLRTG